MSNLIHSISSAKALTDIRNSARESSNPTSPSLGRPDSLTAKSIEVSLLLKGMLGESAASAYLSRQAVEPKIAQRVLSDSGKRRSSDGVDGLIS
jgi:hypothetical protein